ncbi:hypothetical protein PLICRDRAFT_335532 [Plicaturopsis crispa FD-325 SS-3]|uniref:Uncharacterized protein n=1 Tax=Plicaturopsis crispa FD-325 SS-3 TaxID=944288 RepID=A0A0C9SLB7_PLICR|nr:hypothetical protein PLICRDRAFT_335532 [Plicaturopsis crispa FD-325 SS-3]
MSRQPQPSIETISFDDLAALAEAAEKYQVYAALGPCRRYMQLDTPGHPLSVFRYSTTHGHQSMIETAEKLIPFMSSTMAVEELDKLPKSYALAWTSHHGNWTSTLHTAYSSLFQACTLGCPTDECTASIAGIVSSKLEGNVARLLDLDHICAQAVSVVGPRGRNKSNRYACCSGCKTRLDLWRDETKRAVEGIRSFGSYL